MQNSKSIRILLVCGSGASSGFMASNLRKAAAERSLDLKITARSESEIENYVDDMDILMIGPHLEYLLDEINDILPEHVKAFLMRPDYYSTLNGEKALEHLLSEIE